MSVRCIGQLAETVLVRFEGRLHSDGVHGLATRGF